MKKILLFFVMFALLTALFAGYNNTNLKSSQTHSEGYKVYGKFDDNTTTILIGNEKVEVKDKLNTKPIYIYTGVRKPKSTLTSYTFNSNVFDFQFKEPYCDIYAFPDGVADEIKYTDGRKRYYLEHATRFIFDNKGNLLEANIGYYDNRDYEVTLGQYESKMKATQALESVLTEAITKEFQYKSDTYNSHLFYGDINGVQMQVASIIIYPDGRVKNFKNDYPKYLIFKEIITKDKLDKAKAILEGCIKKHSEIDLSTTEYTVSITEAACGMPNLCYDFSGKVFLINILPTSMDNPL